VVRRGKINEDCETESGVFWIHDDRKGEKLFELAGGGGFFLWLGDRFKITGEGAQNLWGKKQSADAITYWKQAHGPQTLRWAREAWGGKGVSEWAIVG